MRPSASEPWGTVCSNGFKKSLFSPRGSSNDVADVVCSQLGFGSFTHVSSFYSEGPHPDAAANPSMPIYLDFLNCAGVTDAAPEGLRGQPWSLEKCSSLHPQINTMVSPPSVAQPSKCLHSDDSAVECVIPKRSFEWRLANAVVGSTGALSRGLVLVRPLPNMPWGTVSSASFVGKGAQAHNNLRLMCELLGFPNASAPRVPSAASGVSYGFLKRQQLPANYVPSRTASLFPSNTAAVGAAGPNYISSVACDVDTAKHFNDCVWGIDNANSFADSAQLSIICDEHELPTKAVLANGMSKSNGQVFVQFQYSDDYYYIPRRVLAANATTIDAAILANSPNIGLLSPVCGAAGFSFSDPSLRLVGKTIAADMAAALPVKWGYTSANDCPFAAFGTRNPIPCRPPSVFQTHRRHSDAFAGTEMAAYPIGVDCYTADTNGGTYSFRLFNHNTGQSSTSRGLVQAQLVTARYPFPSQWATVYEPRRNNFALWGAICESITTPIGRPSVRALRDISEFVLPSQKDAYAYYSKPFDNLLAPVAFEGMDCEGAPTYTFDKFYLGYNENKRSVLAANAKCVVDGAEHRRARPRLQRRFPFV